MLTDPLTHASARHDRSHRVGYGARGLTSRRRSSACGAGSSSRRASGRRLRGATDLSLPTARAYLRVGVRDIASRLFLAILMVAATHLLGWVILAATIIPLGDAAIVLSNDGPKSLAWGVQASPPPSCSLRVRSCSLPSGRGPRCSLRSDKLSRSQSTW